MIDNCTPSKSIGHKSVKAATTGHQPHCAVIDHAAQTSSFLLSQIQVPHIGLSAAGSDRRGSVGQWVRALNFQPGGLEFDPPGKLVPF